MAFCSPPSPLLYDQPLTLALNPLLPPVSPLCLRQSHFLHLVLHCSALKASALKHHFLGCFHVMGVSTSSLALKVRNTSLPVQAAGNQMSSSCLCACAHTLLLLHTDTHSQGNSHSSSISTIYPSIRMSIPSCLHICSRVSPSTYLHTYIYRPTTPPTSFPPSCGSICMPLLLSIHVHTLTIHLFIHCFFHLSIICLSNMPFLTIGPPIPRQE